MSEVWSYDKKKRLDRKGKRWHFLHRQFFLTGIAPGDQPYELYFRDDDNTAFGLLRFDRSKDNPYRDYDLIVRKIIDDENFRQSLLKAKTADVW